MSLFRSRLIVAALAMIAGLTFTLAMGTAAKVEVEVGSLLAHFPMFLLGTAAAWLALSIFRNRLIEREVDNGRS